MDRVLLLGDVDVGALEGALSAADYGLVLASDVADALDRLEVRPADCVLLAETARPPERTIALLRRHGHALPVVVLAGETGRETSAATAGDVAAVAPADDPEAVVARVEAAVDDHLIETRRADRRRQRAAVEAARDDALAASTLDGALAALCRAVVGFGVYDVAWVGRHDAPTSSVVPRTAAGVPLDHLATVSVGEDDDHPTALAVETGVVETRTADGLATVAVPLGDGPAAVLHLVGSRPHGVPSIERETLGDLADDLAPLFDGTEADAPADPDDRVTVLGDALAHEITNQLDIATMYLDLAREGGEESHFGYVESALERMTALADEARLLARGEAAPEPVDLESAATSAWAAVDSGDAHLEIQGGTITADPDLLGLALENLLRNSVEHGSTGPRSRAREDGVEHGSATEDGTHDDVADDPDGPDGTDVTVRIVATDDGFSVEDDGPGIPPDERDRVLEWGYSTEGTGVGLGIVSLVAQRHGWDVSVTESEAGGARFEFR